MTTSVISAANAGEILTDFTMNNLANPHGSVYGSGLTTEPDMFFQLPSAPVDYSSINLRIEGVRSLAPTFDADRSTSSSHIDTQTSKIQLNRNTNGIGICSNYQETYTHGSGSSVVAHSNPGSSPQAGCGGSPVDEAQIEDQGPDESVRFSINDQADPGDDFYFAIREISFGSIGSDDDAIMLFGEGPSDIWMNIAANGFCSPSAAGGNGICTVDLFDLFTYGPDLVVGTEHVAFESDEYWAAFDHFNSNFFQFTTNSTLGANDDWFIRNANWVVDTRIVEEPGTSVPEPMALTLVGAGLMGISIIRRKRQI